MISEKRIKSFVCDGFYTRVGRDGVTSITIEQIHTGFSDSSGSLGFNTIHNFENWFKVTFEDRSFGLANPKYITTIGYFLDENNEEDSKENDNEDQ